MNRERLQAKKTPEPTITGGSFGGPEKASTPASSPLSTPPAAPTTPNVTGAAAGEVVTDLDPITKLVLSEVTVASGQTPAVSAPVATSTPAPGRAVKLPPFAPILLAGGALLCGAALSLRGRHV